MNSNSMCSAVKECRSKSRPNVSQSKLRNEVFNDKTLNPGEKKDTSSSTEDVLQ